MRLIRLGLLAVMASQFMLSPAYAGSEIQTLIDMLHQNGTVSDAQYGRLMAELEQTEKTKQQQEAVERQGQPDDVIAQLKGGPSVKTRDGAFEMKLSGRLQVDAAAYSGKPMMGDGTEIRRAFLTLSGRMYTDWGYRFQYNFVNTGINGRGLLDAYTTYQGFEGVQIQLGNFRDPFILQELTSDKYITFSERALTSAFASGRHIGLMASHVEKKGSWAVGLFGDTISTHGGPDNEGWGANIRTTYSPINEQRKLLHLGLAMQYRDTGGAGELRFKQEAETHISGVDIVDTGIMSRTKDSLKIGAELATVYGPFSAQAEYIDTQVHRNGFDDLNFDGWYAETAYFLTGESRQYKKGKFSSPKPKFNVGEGGIGAWQLALRYSHINLNDGLINGGEADAMTLGLNWFATPTLRFTANYIDVLDVEGGPHAGQEPSVFQVRSQWAF